MIESARALITHNTDPFHNLALEEAITCRLPPGQAVLLLWQNARAVVIGAGQNAWRECHAALLESEGGKLARRSTGGGAVYHDLGNLNFSIIVPRPDYDLDRQFSIISSAVSALGFKAERTGRNDLTIGGRKFSGNAFRMYKHAALHHGTILVDTDFDMMARYLNVSPEKLKSKGVKSAPSRVLNLREQKPVTLDSVRAALLDAFCAAYARAETEEVSDEEFPELPGLIKKYADWQWVYGASPAGAIDLETRFPWGGIQIIANVKNGRAESVSVYTDAMDETLSARLSTALRGAVWKGDELMRCAEQVGEKEVGEWLRGAVASQTLALIERIENGTADMAGPFKTFEEFKAWMESDDEDEI